MPTKTLDERIVKTPGVCGGKPRIDGHRITVQNIVVWHGRFGLSADEIASEYALEMADIYAALAYYFAYQSEVNEAIEQGEAFVREMRQQTPSLLAKKLRGEA